MRPGPARQALGGPPSHGRAALDRELARRRAVARRRRRAQIRRNRLVAGSLSLLFLVVLVVVTTSHGSGLSSPAYGQAVVAPSLRPLLAARFAVGGHPPTLAWPSRGQGAVAVRGVGLMGASRAERSVPIASLTKMMTAFVVLRDHPLAVGAAGPSVRITQADVAAYVRAVDAGDSSVPVRAGEVLDEHQLLEALLLPSADNIADLLGTWDAGSDAAFVGKMNATAHLLGLANTHYADTSGVDPGSRSTAADQARLAADLMGLPVVRDIVRHPSLPFPVAGTITNYNPALGTDGIIGVKSGFTSEAQGCLATAAYRSVGGRSVLVVAVSLGQPDGLYGAARADERLVVSAGDALVPVTVAPASAPAASVAVGWSSATATATTPASPVTAVGWPGLVLHRSLQASPLSRGGKPATGPTRVGTLLVAAPSGVVARVPLRTARPLPPVPAGWAPKGR